MGQGRERGAITVKTLFSFAFLLFASYLAFKFVPVYIAAYDFDNAIKTQAQYSGAMKTNDVILKELLSKAAELELPITKKDLKITRTQSRLTIKADYVVPVKTAFFTYQWRFTEEESAVLF
ncbi:MAG TPA: hypothetical protein VJV23_03710 [Candidatus Polarisedimenticolia bacterium]|nr:hypothetical protein [Candidatus Polarisedimenticolia bacterium]